MKIPKTKSKKPLIALFVVLALAIGSSYYLAASGNHSPSLPNADSPNLSPPTDEEKAAGSQAKDSTINQDSGSTSSKTTTSTVAVELTTMSPYAPNGSNYQIRTMIQGVVSGGTCTLTLTRGGKTITKTVSTQSSAQSSTCQGFDIPVSELSAGSWQLKIVVAGDSYSGSISETIQVQ